MDNAQNSLWWSWMSLDNSRRRPLEIYKIKTVPGRISFQWHLFVLVPHPGTSGFCSETKWHIGSSTSYRMIEITGSTRLYWFPVSCMQSWSFENIIYRYCALFKNSWPYYHQFDASSPPPVWDGNKFVSQSSLVREYHMCSCKFSRVDIGLCPNWGISIFVSPLLPWLKLV